MSAQNGSSSTTGTADSANPDAAQLWRAWLTETERQLNGFFGEILGTEEFARISGNFVDGYAVVQNSLNQQMERYLNTFNLPTHSDIIELAERLNGIEERISALETTLRNVADKVGVAASSQPTPIRPRRTRQPKN